MPPLRPAWPAGQCFGCSPDNPAGLRLEFHADAGGLTAAFTPAAAHESYPGVLHGGLAATVLDEVMGNVLALVERRLCFTVSLRVQFAAPLRTGRAYRVRGWAAEAGGAEGVYRVRGEIVGAADGLLMASGVGLYRWIGTADARAVFDARDADLAALRDWFRPE